MGVVHLKVLTGASQSVVPSLAASGLPWNLLKMQTFRSRPRPFESESLGVVPGRRLRSPGLKGQVPGQATVPTHFHPSLYLSSISNLLNLQMGPALPKMML